MAALPIRRAPTGDLSVLLVTSRQTRRWIIPKGNLIKGLPDHEAAAVEALEEAGVVGEISSQSIGSYTFRRQIDSRWQLIRVAVYLLEVRQQLDTFKEQAERELRWCTILEAADLVREEELQALIRSVDGDLRAQAGQPESGDTA
ncbi:ADP-ribose pyrophosphatase YjhB (NUDIX family) [Rhodoligotrophos appendicifer]|uniref:NUDIX hydrolase n=1 Tax=Rhodoligotrophos appendicifer TaxID=987056 RepID=UPI001FE77AFB|nr:NUDIX hydrolase [Rhodoligotrophos appendicifer]